MIPGKAAPPRYVADRPYANPERAGRRLMHHARSAPRLQPNQPDTIYTEQVNGPFLFKDGASPVEYSAGMKWLINESCIEMHESGCFFTLHPKGNDLFEA